ncbi:cytochrome P450 2 sub U member 1 [Branchiostoma belcheri]|nr:cytochrome P450 2 sub U member 1 [Branchiostoma belcheri]
MAFSTWFLGLFPFNVYTFLVFCVAFLLTHLFVNRLRDFPPSPAGGLPLLGHLLTLGARPHLKLTEWRGQYGDVYSIRMGLDRAVVLSGYRVIREALVDCRDVFSSRPDLYLPNAVSGCGKDIVMARWGQAYRERRRFASSVLKTLGMKEGTGSAEDVIRQQAHKLCHTVITNLWSAHMDPEFWPDPERFNPDRHLDREGKLIKNPESFMPFSVGRRMCLGERLAKMELFLFFTAMMQQFSFVSPEGSPTPSTDGVFGITLSPKSYRLCAVAR